MRSVVALLATVLASAALAACGDGGAEPGAPERATLVLDFQPNAVHAGIYAALAEGYYSDAGVDLKVQEPSSSTDAPKLLEAGRADFAILDIHDLGIAREQGLDVAGVVPIVQTPLAAVIARARSAIRGPRDLAGKTVGVTGLPSDDAVLDSVLQATGVGPAQVHRVTIGFQAIASLAAGRVDAATAFWNAEGVVLRRQGVATREFRVDRYGAPRYPELVVCASQATLRERPGLARAVVGATVRGYRLVVDRPGRALSDLLREVATLDAGIARAQLRTLTAASAFEPVGSFDRNVLRDWARWDLEHGILDRPLDVSAAFAAP